ncbi:unnamed protein product [Phytophthora lilii]|uniref:Unnamed protein product n=1 Tax=Phytophthora lilii TaxID=2077276 RepID=A0A9W6TV80_9STRA|nr:unnamed protein product [Phytophthora lilii]
MRLFLSNNKLDTFEAIEPLFQVLSINELRLDSNGVCGTNQMEYRGRMIRGFPSLKHLDLKPLSDADRREALLHANSPSKNGINGDDAEAAARAHAMSCIKATWERRVELSHSPTNMKDSRDLMPLSSWGQPGKEDQISHVGYEEREITPSSREELTMYSNNSGFSEVEIYGDYRVLVIYGNALEALELTKAHGLVNAVSFRYVGISKIMSTVVNATNANLKLFTRLRRLIFAYNDLHSFDELLWLKPPELSSLLPSKARVKEVKDMKPSRSSAALHSNVPSSAVTEIFDAASDIEKKAAVSCLQAGITCTRAVFTRTLAMHCRHWIRRGRACSCLSSKFVRSCHQPFPCLLF